MTDLLKPTALAVVAAALAILADLLLREASWGINFGIWSLLVGSVCLAIGRRTPLKLTKQGKLLAGFAIVFALLFSLRDSDGLKMANGIALFFCFGAMFIPKGEQSLKELTVGTLLASPVVQFLALPAHLTLLSKKAYEARQISEDAKKRSGAITRGLLIAAPLLLLFGGLFSSADAVFKSKLESAFRFDLNLASVNAHVWTLLLGALFAGGLLYRLVYHLDTPTPPPIAVDKPPSNVGMIEVGIVLSSLVILFGAFIAVQFRYLFGAQDVVRVTQGLSYAEYARGGFFELVCVAALSLVLLLGADSILNKKQKGDEIMFQWLGRILVAMVFCIVWSAMTRMRLYTDVYGLTELRVYASIFMGWLSLSFLWLLVTTLRGHSRRFAFGAFCFGLLTIFSTNLLNPEAVIARTNLSKPNADFAYLKSLSDDAVLAILEMMNTVPEAHRAGAEELIKKRREALRTGDWRETNLTRFLLAR